MSLSVIQSEIREWSARQFGSQTSKVTHQELGSLAPLLGIVEEIGELATALLEDQNDSDVSRSETGDAIVDALADVMVYACDWANREGDVDLSALMIAADEDSTPIMEDSRTSIIRAAAAAGELCHVTLKRHQAIRGYEDYAKYTHDRDKAMKVLLTQLINIADDYWVTLLDELTTTWNKVKSRDWVNRPNDANQHEVV